jgi:hypothetical protein
MADGSTAAPGDGFIHHRANRLIFETALMSRWSDEQTDDPHYADQRDFYKLEKWTKDGTKVDRLLYATISIRHRRFLWRPSSTGRGSG